MNAEIDETQWEKWLKRPMLSVVARPNGLIFYGFGTIITLGVVQWLRSFLGPR